MILRKTKKLKNTLLALSSALALTACGGGGSGGGPVGVVNDFINEDLSNLSGSTSIVSSYSNLLSSFTSTIAGGDFGGLQAVITGPDAEDQATANTLLTQLQQAETLWEQSETLIADQSDANKYKIYNSASYKEAYAAMVYLKEHVRPIITRVSQGKTITLEQLNMVAKEDKALEIINTEKEGSAVEYANAKLKAEEKIEPKKSTEEIYNEIEDGTPLEDFSNATWKYIPGAGGKQEKKGKVITPQTKVVKTKICEWTETTKLAENGSVVIPTTKICRIETVETDQQPKVEPVVQYQNEGNPIQEDLTVITFIPGTVEKGTKGEEFNSAYGTDGVHTDPQEQVRTPKTETVPGSESTSTEFRSVIRFEATGTNNQHWEITDQYKKTTVTKPAVKTTYDIVTYKDVKTKQKRTWTIKTESKTVTYKDGTTETFLTPKNKEYTSWNTGQISDESRTVREKETSENIFLTPDITDVFFKQLSKVLKSAAYTDDDENLGTKTTGLSTTASDFHTTEFNKDTSKSMINADKAYARGWTGKGAVLGVIDSYQETDHEALDGKYKWYNDYVRYEDGTTDSNGNELGTVANGGKNVSHGTHVAGIVAGKRDGTEFHGVAFDAELVGANIDYYGHGGAHMSFASQALQDITKLKSTTAQGGENMNIIAVNMSFNKTNANHHYGTVTQLSDGTYSAPKITGMIKEMRDGEEITIQGGSQYWEVATNNDIILVNSAGNGLYVNGAMNYDYALDPGIWATEVDSSNNLILGGKMIIVGNWGGTKANGQVVGSKAGHVCLDIVDNACNDTYKTSDFYILAPGNSVYSSVPGDGYTTMGGSSMAAPQVTGAMGILHQMWPHMKGENLVKLVLNTADTNINGYNVNIHGQGMLDLDEATQPQGAIGIPTTGRVDGATVDVNNTYFATGNTSAFSSLANLKIMVIDDYDRDYYMNLGSGMTVKDNRKYSDIDMLMSNNNTYLPTQQMYGSFTQGGQYNLINNMNFGLYTGDNGAGDYSANIGKNFMLHKNFKLKTSIGQMSEQETWLGNSSDGALGVGDNNNTNFGNLGVEYALGNNVLSLDYTKGYTDINTTDGSMIKNFSDIESESYRLAYEIHKDKHTTFGWSFSLPSHITSGTMDLEVAESVNLDGTLNYTNFKSDLTQTTKEKNLGFFYSKTPDHDLDASFNFSAEYRQDVAGQNGKDGVNVAFNYVKKFSGACGFLWMKNPKCYNADGSKKDMKSMYANNGVDNATKHGLVYDLETDKFVPIKK